MKGSELDICLSRGYFRSRQDVFTRQYVFFGGTYYPAYWLRIDLANVRFGPKQARLFRVNEQFSVRIKPFVLNQEAEELYSAYRNKLDFTSFDSLEACLMGGATQTFFDTHIIELRDGNKLIAGGIFDAGERSIAGILNFYDPAYRKLSLGKYLMLLKIQYARLHQKAYYYPGYLAGGYSKFDYKLFPCEAATQVLDDSSNQWHPFSWEIVTSLFLDRLAKGSPLAVR